MKEKGIWSDMEWYGVIWIDMEEGFRVLVISDGRNSKGWGFKA